MDAPKTKSKPAGRAEDANIPSPASKEELLTVTAPLPYQERIRVAANVGRKSGAAKAKPIVDELRKVPVVATASAAPAGGSARDLTRTFDQVRLSLAIAGAAGQADVFKEELQSENQLFKRISATEFVRLQPDDAVLIGLIGKSVPSTQTKLMHACIQHGRVAVVDAAVQQLVARGGANTAAKYLHGCKSETVAKLIRDQHVRENKDLHWNLICRHHGAVIVGLMREELAAVPAEGRAGVWQSWEKFFGRRNGAFFEELAYNAHQTVPLMQLAFQFPLVTLRSSPSSPLKPIDTQQTLPPLIDKHFKHFSKFCMNELIEFGKENIIVRHGTVTNYCPGNITNLVNQLSRGGEPRYCFAYLTHALALRRSTNGNAVSSPHNIENEMFRHIAGTVTEKWSVADVEKFMDLFIEYFPSRIPNPNASYYSQWINDCTQMYTNIISHMYSKLRKASNKLAYITDKAAHATALEKYRALAAKVSALLQRLRDDFIRKTVAKEIERSNNYAFTALKALSEGLLPVFAHSNWKLLEPEILHCGTHPVPTITSADSQRSNTWETYVQHFADTVYSYDYPHFTPEELKLTAAQRKMFLDMRVARYSAHPLVYKAQLNQLISKHDDLVDQLFGAFSVTNLRTLLETQPDPVVFQMLTRLMPKEKRFAAVKALLESGGMVRGSREELVQLQDIKDAKIRGYLQKACDTSSAAERAAAFKILLKTTYTAADQDEITKTLQFIRRKIKNETAEQRQDALNSLISEANSKGGVQACYFLKNPLTDEDLAVWFELLADALESQDLDSSPNAAGREFVHHPILSHFSSLASAALSAGCVENREDLFNFGVEIQWRAMLFRKGEKRAAQEFYINFGDYGKDSEAMHNFFNNTHTVTGTDDTHKQAELQKFINMYLNAYAKRIGAKNPSWATKLDYQRPLITGAGKFWHHSSHIVSLLTLQLKELREQTQKDADGLLLLESHHPCVTLFTEVMAHHKVSSTMMDDFPLLREYVELLLHSRLAMRVLSVWKRHQLKGVNTKRERVLATSKVVEKLLSISPSAIYLRFVWRHMMRYRQDLLDRYLDSGAAFRGVFYGLGAPKKVEAGSAPAGSWSAPARRGRAMRGRGGRSGGFRGGGKRGKGKAKGKKGKGGKGGKKGKPSRGRGGAKPTGPPKPAAKKYASLLERVQAEKVHDEEMHRDKVGGDHKDVYCLGAMYGLRRLQPAQLAKLAKQLLAQVLNPNRSMPERVRAAIRWTLLPNVSHREVTAFLSQHKALEQTEASATALPANIVDAILKGVMRDDCPLSPLAFLFTPAYLSTSRARFSLIVANHCVPYMVQGGLTSTFKTLLDGDLRKFMKVTMFKQMCRLLLQHPSEEQLGLVLAQWRRNDVHRDVKITILREGNRLLLTEQFGASGWQILEAALKDPNPEVLVSILGSSHGSIVEKLKSLFQKTRNAKFLSILKFIEVPLVHRNRYARTVVWHLATTATDDDLKWLAIGALGNWGNYGLAEEASHLLATECQKVSADSFRGKKAHEIELFDKRWSQSMGTLLRFCGLLKKTEYKSASTEHVVNVVAHLAKVLVALPVSERFIRTKVMELITAVTSRLPDNGQFTLYSPIVESDILQPLRDIPLFSDWFEHRAMAVFKANPSKSPDVALEMFKKLLYKAIEGSPRDMDGTKTRALSLLGLFPGNEAFRRDALMLDGKLAADPNLRHHIALMAVNASSDHETNGMLKRNNYALVRTLYEHILTYGAIMVPYSHYTCSGLLWTLVGRVVNTSYQVYHLSQAEKEFLAWLAEPFVAISKKLDKKETLTPRESVQYEIGVNVSQLYGFPAALKMPTAAHFIRMGKLAMSRAIFQKLSTDEQLACLDVTFFNTWAQYPDITKGDGSAFKLEPVQPDEQLLPHVIMSGVQLAQHHTTLMNTYLHDHFDRAHMWLHWLVVLAQNHQTWVVDGTNVNLLNLVSSVLSEYFLRHWILSDPKRVNPVAVKELDTWTRQVITGSLAGFPPAFVHQQATQYLRQITATWHSIVFSLVTNAGGRVISQGMSWPPQLVDTLDFLAANALPSVRSMALTVQVAIAPVSNPPAGGVRSSGANYDGEDW